MVFEAFRRARNSDRGVEASQETATPPVECPLIGLSLDQIDEAIVALSPRAD